jgi:glycosyltransferase involved in cell wall biosynthesis
LYLGWVIPTKGIDELIEAWARLDLQRWRLRIIGPLGDVGYEERLMAQHRPNGAEFVGEMSHNEAMIALAKADAFVLPSYTEGFPNVVLEAMALGKPIVATRVGAIPEMLADGCGVLVAPRDVEALTDALSRVLQSNDLQYALGSRARDRALKEYRIDAVFGQLEKVWRNAARAER